MQKKYLKFNTIIVFFLHFLFTYLSSKKRRNILTISVNNLTITTKLRKIPTVRIIFDYEIHNQEQELLTIASTTLVFVDAISRKPILCPSDILEAIEKELSLI